MDSAIGMIFASPLLRFDLPLGIEPKTDQNTLTADVTEAQS